MFGKLFGKKRATGAKVDTKLFTSEVALGDEIAGRVEVTGGSAGQNIRGITVELVARCIIEGQGDRRTYGDISLASGLFEAGWVEAGAEAFVEFTLEVPKSAPISVGSTEVFLRTRIDIEGAEDSYDADGLRLLPSREMGAVLSGIERAGFHLVEAEVERRPWNDGLLIQEFDFRPNSYSDYGIEEVEVAFEHRYDGIRVYLTVDRRGGFFMMGGENTVIYDFSFEEIGNLDMGQVLREAIDKLS